MSLAVALEHHERGLALLPVQGRGKEPNYAVLKEVHGEAAWSSLARRRATPAEIKAWHDIDPQTNVGVILGQPSGGLVVADFDRRPRCVTHPPTPVVSTGRGWHAYLRAACKVATRGYPWGELRGDGSYVVLPDSVHPSGKPYAYVITLDEVPIAPLADCALRKVRLQSVTSTAPKTGTQARHINCLCTPMRRSRLE